MHFDMIAVRFRWPYSASRSVASIHTSRYFIRLFQVLEQDSDDYGAVFLVNLLEIAVPPRQPLLLRISPFLPGAYGVTFNIAVAGG